MNKELIESSRVGTQSWAWLLVSWLLEDFCPASSKAAVLLRAAASLVSRNTVLILGPFISLFPKGLREPYPLDRHAFNCLLALQIRVRAFSPVVLTVGNLSKVLVFFS